MWIFPNLPQNLNVDKIPQFQGPRTKNGCDGPVIWHPMRTVMF